MPTKDETSLLEPARKSLAELVRIHEQRQPEEQDTSKQANTDPGTHQLQETENTLKTIH